MNDELDKAIAASAVVEESAPRVVINAGLYNGRKAQLILPADTTDEELLYVVSVLSTQGRAAVLAAREVPPPSPIVTRPHLIVPGRGN